MYKEEDRIKAVKTEKNELARCLILAGLLLMVGIVFFVLRKQGLCLLFLLLGLFSAIFLADLRVLPARNYRKWLEEILSGTSHETVGRLIRIGDEEVMEDGNCFHELVINIYEDNAEEGLRRFLLDSSKTIQIPEGTIVTVTSHDHWVLKAAVREHRG